MKPIENIAVPSKYELYLRSPEFAEIRQKVFARDNYKCVVCGSKEKLVPHHLTYVNVYNEQLHDLITVCSRCHAIYHNIEKRKDYIESFYHQSQENYYKKLQEEREENARRYKEEETRRKRECDSIVQEIKDEYLNKDYCKNGDLDMCDWTVLNPIIEKKAEEHEVSPFGINKSKLQKWFIYRRCEFFKRCLDANISLSQMQQKTKFDHQYLWRWYSRPKVEAKLNEEKELFKEDY